MTCHFPRLAEGPDLGSLLDVERLPSSNFSVELCRFIPSFAAHSAVALVAALGDERAKATSLRAGAASLRAQAWTDFETAV
jgi:hypothetical protein